MFDLDEFISSCVAARAEGDAVLAVKEVLDRALATPGPIIEALPPTEAELSVLYASADLTILKIVWSPSMTVPPHDHLMWAVNGIYVGDEDNTFYRRGPGRLVEVGGKRVSASQSAALGRDVIHAVTNPSARACTGSIHVYGGDYLSKKRSVWDPETHEEQPADGDTVRRLFDEARARSREL